MLTLETVPAIFSAIYLLYMKKSLSRLLIFLLSEPIAWHKVLPNFVPQGRPDSGGWQGPEL